MGEVCIWEEGYPSCHSDAGKASSANYAEPSNACNEDASRDISSWSDVSSQSEGVSAYQEFSSCNEDWSVLSKDGSSDASSRTDVSLQSPFRKQKRGTHGNQSWFNFQELADLIKDIETNEHPYTWLVMLLKQKFPTTPNGKDVLEIPSKLSGCQSPNRSTVSERRAYVAVSAAANPVMNAGRLALLFASKALSGTTSSVPEVVNKSDKRFTVAAEFLKQVPK
jgi:hypothetical protein